ncbi:unnamed protein product [Paramecium pentaurelia]|uniref:Glycerol-3-phosphate dehydrogenase [NAD(+)], glycosomal n=1 Tax=Paramecium pentaurelia TaxID=43138 RepID=A0A8S1V146_9CILI|nr:unnamed protein product [Paramecium pentaurelia]
MANKYKVCVLGSGAFGTAMAHCAINNPYIGRVQIYARNQTIVESINREHKNPKFLSNFALHPDITATTDLQQALHQANYVLSCIPTQEIHQFVLANKQYIDTKVPFVSCSKGIILKSGKLISQMLNEEFDGKLRYACLSGPSFAAELMQNNPSCVVVASQDTKTSKLVQLGLSGNFLRIFTQSDVVGVELAGALKNLVAIGTGVLDGAGFGINTQTAYVTRSVGEMQRFARIYGASKHTFYGLAGFGDLMLTSFGSLSRNRAFGIKVGKGEKVEDILKESKGVVEGWPTLELVYKQAQENNIEMPMTLILHDFIKRKYSKEQSIQMLMNRAFQDEFEPTFEDLL